MKSSRNIRNYFRIAAKHRGILSIFTVGIVTVIVISGVATVKLCAATEDNSIRPFHVNVPDEQLVDLRKCIATKQVLLDATIGRVLARDV